MHAQFSLFRSGTARASALIALIAAGWFGATFVGSAKDDKPVIVRGVVAGIFFTAPAGSSPSTTVASVYEDAKVCADDNGNAVCDHGEASTVTDRNGAFELPSRGAVIAEITTRSRNGGHKVTGRFVLRASAEQIVDAADTDNRGGHDDRRGDNGHDGDHGNGPTLKSHIAITPLSTEVVRMMAANHQSFANARHALATRLDVPTTEVLRDPNEITNETTQTALLTESVVLTNRLVLAAKMVDRHDVSPAALAKHPGDTTPTITMPEAIEASMNLEEIPLRPRLRDHAGEQGDHVDQELAVCAED